MIGLCIRVKLDRCLPRRLKSRVYITPGSHNTEESLNRQINDKERVAAALENPSLHILFAHLTVCLNNNQGHWEMYCWYWFSWCGCIGQWVSSISVSLIGCLERNRTINDNHRPRLFSNDKKSPTHETVPSGFTPLTLYCCLCLDATFESYGAIHSVFQPLFEALRISLSGLSPTIRHSSGAIPLRFRSA